MEGIININKPKGITSFDVIRKLKKILQMRKIGHTGTLDPLATGVLVICLGKATKLASLIEAKSKTYIAEFELGYSTDTYDIEGKIVDEVKEFDVSEEELREAIKEFEGEQKQIPPKYSALKINGKKMYELARANIDFEVKARDVKIDYINLINFNGKKVIIETKVSKGTYIRSLVNDIGERLDTFATMTNLERISVETYNVKNSFKLEEIEEMKNNDDLDFIKSVEDSFDYFNETSIETDKDYNLFVNGNTLLKLNNKNGYYRVYYKEEFLGLAIIENERMKSYKYIKELA